jgi:hypothetical protein
MRQFSGLCNPHPKKKRKVPCLWRPADFASGALRTEAMSQAAGWQNIRQRSNGMTV